MKAQAKSCLGPWETLRETMCMPQFVNASCIIYVHFLLVEMPPFRDSFPPGGVTYPPAYLIYKCGTAALPVFAAALGGIEFTHGSLLCSGLTWSWSCDFLNLFLSLCSRNDTPHSKPLNFVLEAIMQATNGNLLR